MKKIVMIDDHTELMASLERALRSGIVLEECHSATEAIAAIMLHSPDVILLDHQLSDKGSEGFQVVEWIKNQGLKIEIYTTTKNSEAKKAYAAMGIGWVDKNNLAELKKLIIGAQ